MSDERWERIQAIFQEALELGSAEREAFLADKCAADPSLREEIDALLQVDRTATSNLEEPDEFTDAGFFGEVDRDSENTLPEKIGAFRIVSVLGQGGMGVVYLGQQTEPIKRRVAVKLVRVGMDSQQIVSRFNSERQALALMNLRISLASSRPAKPRGRGRTSSWSSSRTAFRSPSTVTSML